MLCAAFVNGSSDVDEDNRSFSVCRPAGAKFEIIGLGNMLYWQDQEELWGDEAKPPGGHLYLWTSRDEIISKNFPPASISSVFESVAEFLPNIGSDVIAYALVWPDIAIGSNLDDVARVLRSNVGFQTGPGYETYSLANDAYHSVEVGCAMNLLRFATQFNAQ